MALNDESAAATAASAGAALRLAAIVGAVYAAFGIAWILLSDALVAAISTDPGWLVMVQRYKGLLYVGLTAIGLVVLVRAANLRLLRTDAARRSHELQARDLFERHPQPMWVCDSETGAFLRVNDAAVRDYGYTVEEFGRMTLADLRPAEDKLSPPPARQTSRDTTTARYRKKSGDVVHVQLTSHDVPSAGRSALMVMAVDITAQWRAARLLERQEAQFRQLHRSLGEVLWLASVDGRELRYVSPAFEPVFGRSCSAFERRPGLWLEMVHPDDRALAQASSDALARQGEASCEYRIVRPDGTLRWISDRKRAIVDDEGRVQMIGGIAEDITAAKERDAVLATTNAELERRVAARTAELERVNLELDAFTRTVAHDLKSPLTAIAGFSRLLQLRHGAALGADGAQMAAQIEHSALHMASLVNDLLALSRVSAVELQPREIDLAALARELIDEWRRNEPGRALQFEAPATLTALCDAGLARSLMSNLLGNAWKFTAKRADAQIRLTAEPSGAGITVRIDDNGAGFDSSRLDGMFKPFQRFHPASEFSGTGIGLVTCQRIVARHGGQTWVESNPGQGTRVSFTLPAQPGGVQAPATV